VSLIAYLILLAVWGLIIGAFARLALPGRDPLTIPQTIGLGLAGSLFAGIVVRLLSGGQSGAGFLAALVFSVVILYFIRRHRGGGLTSPGEPRPPR
jgi:uncharacterized membrane protein YeaQ/YmgE (transglycosylase-associated protein family)